MHKRVVELSGTTEYHALFSALALGDGRIHAAFKRARISDENSTQAVEEFLATKIVRLEKSRKQFVSWIDDERISDKLLFTTPFLRFWFAFVAPIFKGIKEGNYEEFNKRYTNKISEFRESIFKELVFGVIEDSFKDDPLTEIGDYWDRNVEFDIFAKTTSKKVIVGKCSYSNAKLKKSEISKLQELASKAKIQPDILVLVAKNGFSNELKNLKGENLKLFTLKNLKKRQ